MRDLHKCQRDGRGHIYYQAIGREEDGPGRVRLSGPFTQAEIAALYGCSRANIHLIEMRALRKLRKVLGPTFLRQMISGEKHHV